MAVQPATGRPADPVTARGPRSGRASRRGRGPGHHPGGTWHPPQHRARQARTGAGHGAARCAGSRRAPGQPDPVYPPGQFSPWNRASTRPPGWASRATGGGTAEADPGYSALAMSDAAADLTSTQTWAVIDDEPPSNPSLPARAPATGARTPGNPRGSAPRPTGPRTSGPGPGGGVPVARPSAAGRPALAALAARAGRVRVSMNRPRAPKDWPGRPPGRSDWPGPATGPQDWPGRPRAAQELAGPATGPQRLDRGRPPARRNRRAGGPDAPERVAPGGRMAPGRPPPVPRARPPARRRRRRSARPSEAGGPALRPARSLAVEGDGRTGRPPRRQAGRQAHRP